MAVFPGSLQNLRPDLVLPSKYLATFATLGALICSTALAAPPATTGFEEIDIPQASGPALHGGIWYPSTSPASPVNIEFTTQNLALHGAVAGPAHRLIVISHGAFGTWKSHCDTAESLAKAGFIVAAVTYDDFTPNSVLRLYDRSRQVAEVIDYATMHWHGNASIDPTRVGAVGFSIGGYTTLVAAGGKPDVSKLQPHCLTAPAEWSCTMTAAHHLDLTGPPGAEAFVTDPRIKAIVVMAPAMGYVFEAGGLSRVHMPVQLWRATNDHVITEPWGAQAVLHALPGGAEYHEVKGADHSDFVAPCPADTVKSAPMICGDPTAFDRAAFHAKLNAAIVAFFQAKL